MFITAVAWKLAANIRKCSHPAFFIVAAPCVNGTQKGDANFTTQADQHGKDPPPKSPWKFQLDAFWFRALLLTLQV